MRGMQWETTLATTLRRTFPRVGRYSRARSAAAMVEAAGALAGERGVARQFFDRYQRSPGRNG